METKTKYAQLVNDVEATFIHGVTGQEVSEDVLAAGTLVRDVETSDGDWGGTLTTFLASTDGGRLWYRYRTYDDVQISD